MMARTVFSVLVVAGVFFTEKVSAQQLPLQARARPIRSGGNVGALRPGLIEVKTATGESWLLKVDARGEKISVTGAADRSFLRPGMLVRFTAELTKKGEATQPIKKLSIFTPRPGYGIGLMREAGNDSQPTTEAPQRNRRTARTKLAGTYLVAGRLSGIKGNTLQVNAQRRSVRGELADDVKIDVDVMGDYSMIRPGDEVMFTGSYLQKGKAIAKSLEFKAAKPFAGTQRKARENRRQPKAKTKKRGNQQGEEKPSEGDQPDDKE